MKQSLLLLSAAFVAFSGFAADEIDVTRAGYYFYKTGEMCAEAGGGYHGANIQISPDNQQFGANIFYNYGFDKMYKDGLLVIGGGQYHNDANGYYKNCKAGLQVVDLGGEVGPCLAFVVGDNKVVNEAVKDASGRDCGITAATTGGLNWFNFNFFTDPDKTPIASDGAIRVRVVCNVFSPAYGTHNIVNTVHFKTQENGMKNANGYGAITANEFFKKEVDPEDEDNTINVYDPTKWLVYEFVDMCPDKDEDKETGYSPMRIVFNLPGSLAAGTTLFIREISFWQVPDKAVDEDHPFEAAPETHEYITLNMGAPTTGISEVVAEETATVSVNGNTAVFNAPAVVYNLTGAQVATGTEATLAKGIYVARIGEKAVKFAVK